jgi:hypothetical protein
MFDALLGNASEIGSQEANAEVGQLFVDNEKVIRAYKVVRDLFIFTNLRLILVDKQGISGKKVEYQSIPYKSITRFAVETAGTFDRDAEIKIWISGGEMVQREVKKGVPISEIQKILATLVLLK